MHLHCVLLWKAGSQLYDRGWPLFIPSRAAVLGGCASRAASMDVIGWCFKRQRYRTSSLFLKIARARGSHAPTSEALRSCAVLVVGHRSGFVPTPTFSKADIREHMAGPTRINFTIRSLLVCIVFHTKNIKIVKLGPR